MRRELQTWHFWLSVVAILISVFALVQTQEANRIAREAKELTQLTLEPTLVAEIFISYSVDLLDERDSKRVVRDSITVEPPSGLGKTEANRYYAWLFIKNKGSGLANILSVETAYSLDGNSAMVRLKWGEPRVVSPGDTLAIRLGYLLTDFRFTDKVKVTYTGLFDKNKPIEVTFAPDGILPHKSGVADITITATPNK